MSTLYFTDRIGARVYAGDKMILSPLDGWTPEHLPDVQPLRVLGIERDRFDRGLVIVRVQYKSKKIGTFPRVDPNQELLHWEVLPGSNVHWIQEWLRRE